MAGSRPLTRTKRTMRRLSPLVREVQSIQNDLVALARRLDRLQQRIAETEAVATVNEAERRRLQRETAALVGELNAEHAAAAMTEAHHG